MFFHTELVGWLAHWLVGWLIGWLAGWLAGRSLKLGYVKRIVVNMSRGSCGANVPFLVL